MGGSPVLETIRSGVTLEPGAAASFRRLEARLGRRADVNRTYADYVTQLRMYNAWQAWVSGRGPKPNHSRALHPDDSVHCQGRAWDTDDWRIPGFIALAAEYGWIRTAASDPTEQHHFEYQWWRDQHRNDPKPASGGTAAHAPSNPILQEDDMATLVTGGGQNLIIGNKLIPLTSAAQVQSIEGAQLLKVSPEVHYNIIQAFNRPDSAALPTLVYVRNGDGTVYLLTDGKLEALVDPTTLSELHGKGAVSVTLSQAEITNLMNT